MDIVRHFVYDLFFFKSPRNHLLVGIVVALWPEVFPKVDSELASTPVVQTIVWCVFNTGPETFSVDMKIGENRDNFESETGFRANSYQAETLVKNFIALAKQSMLEGGRLQEITKSLLLIGRCKGHRWVHNNIISRLMKSLSVEGDQTFLAWVISTLGLLSRVYPADGRENIREIFQSVAAMLSNREIEPELEKSCVLALFHLGYHLQLQVWIQRLFIFKRIEMI